MITERALNRALLARQGLLEPFAAPPTAVVASIGAIQTQYWPSLGPALWARTDGYTRADVYQALQNQALLNGTLLRGTIHTVTAQEYPAYAAVTAASKAGTWVRTREEPTPEAADLQRELLELTLTPRTAEEINEWIEEWLTRHPRAFGEAELAYQRQYRWRPFRSQPWLVRAPADGTWGPKTPNAYLTAPMPAGDGLPATGQALATVIRCHLRAFGPAAAEDVASWIAWNLTPVREALRRVDDLVTFTDEAGRTLYDLADAPRPGPDADAPVRLLPWFDSVLLAYAPKRRTRILPEAYRDIVYVKANGQLKPTFLVDGLVAGMWSIATAKRTATVTLTPLQPLAARVRRGLAAEAEQLAGFCHPDATTRRVEFV